MRARARELAHIPRRDELGYTPPFTEDWMRAQRRIGDPLGDATIAALRDRHPLGDPEHLLAEVQHLATTEGGVFADFVAACSVIPEWADFAAMRAGQRLYATTGPFLTMSIFGGGVAGSAWHADAEPVFTATGRFVVPRGVSQRLVETGAILFLLPFPGEVQPGGRHHRVVMQVRLLHAAIRHWLTSRPDGYDVDTVGVPINQADLGYAVLIFTYLFVRGLLRLGIDVSDAQIDSLHLLWRWIGHVIGVDDAWMCDSIEAQQAMCRAFLAMHARDGEVAVAARGLMDGALTSVPAPFQGVARRTLHQLTADLGGADYLRGLKLDTSGPQLELGVIKAAGRAYNLLLRAPGGEPALHLLGSQILRRRYATFGTASGGHEYGVVTADPDDVNAAMAASRAEIAAANG